MKAVKRGAGAGNKNHIKRNAFPDVSQDKLDEEVDCYIRSMGVAASFDLLEYKNLQGQQAEQPKALFKLQKLVEAVLKVSPSAQIKYGQLRQSLQIACKKFGMELLSAHWQVENAHLPGKAADALCVMLKHWRRVTASQTAWDKFGRKLEESHFKQLQRLYKMMQHGGQTGKAKRELTAHISDVTVDSTGMPAMLKASSEEGEENISDFDSKGSLMDSPPPVAKGLWREMAGKPLKKKTCYKSKRNCWPMQKTSQQAQVKESRVGRWTCNQNPHSFLECGGWQVSSIHTTCSRARK